jgi:hypothetical protein
MQEDKSDKAIRIGNIFAAQLLATVGTWTEGIPITDTNVVH